jgi:hypothetical protein
MRSPSASVFRNRSGLLPGLARLWYGAFISQRWTIGTGASAGYADLGWLDSAELSAPLAHGDFLADPFFVPHTGGRVLLCEWMQARRGRGVIARVEFDHAGKISDLRTLIEWAPYHLSYPHIFEYQGELYCCPEACYSRTVRLFRLDSTAERIIDSRDVFERFASVDPTIFEYQGRWWLFCTNADRGESNSTLYAFHAESPFGPWAPHAGNPIVVDSGSARPAGRVMQMDGRVFRPAQDCSVRYGGSLKMFEIERLTPSEYSQKLVWHLRPPVGPRGKHGVHTINSDDGFTVYDAYTERFSPVAWLHRLQERLRSE